MAPTGTIETTSGGEFASRHHCPDCTFVTDFDPPSFPNTVQKLVKKAGKKPKFCGLFTMPGWSGHNGFYVFRCQECRQLSIDYPHGYTGDGLRSGLLYLRCGICDYQSLIYDKKIYAFQGISAPPSLWKIFKRLLKRELLKT